MRRTVFIVAILFFLSLLLARFVILGALILACFDYCAPNGHAVITVWLFIYSLGFVFFFINWGICLSRAQQLHQQIRFRGILISGLASIALLTAARIIISVFDENHSFTPYQSLIALTPDNILVYGGFIWMIYFSTWERYSSNNRSGLVTDGALPQPPRRLVWCRWMLAWQASAISGNTSLPPWLWGICHTVLACQGTPKGTPP